MTGVARKSGIAKSELTREEMRVGTVCFRVGTNSLRALWLFVGDERSRFFELNGE